PVLIVTLPSKATTRGLAVAILDAIEHQGFTTGPDKGNEASLLRRANHLLRQAETRLLILDEFHHVTNTDNDHVAHTVGETIKKMLIEGVAAIVLSGTEKARLPFLHNKQLGHRCMAVVHLDRLDLEKPADASLFMRFLSDYLRALELQGIAS